MSTCWLFNKSNCNEGNLSANVFVTCKIYFHYDFSDGTSRLDLLHGENHWAVRHGFLRTPVGSCQSRKFLCTLLLTFTCYRKKNSQVSFLHLYHHTLMPICAFIGVKYFGGKLLNFLHRLWLLERWDLEHWMILKIWKNVNGFWLI